MPDDDFLSSLREPDPQDAITDDNLLGSEVTEPEVEAAPEQDEPVNAAPVNDDPYGLKALADQQREVLKAQQEQLARQNAPQPQAAPKPLMEQDEWITRYDEASENASWDINARATLRRMNQELANEAAQGIEARVRNEMQAQFRADTVVGTLRSEARTLLGDLVDDATLDEVAAQVFGGDRALMGTAMQDQTVRRLVMEAAAGRRMLAGKTAPPAAPARPTPPASVQSGARNTRPAAPQDKAKLYTDKAYMSGVIDDLLFGKPKQDHEELLK